MNDNNFIFVKLKLPSEIKDYVSNSSKLFVFAMVSILLFYSVSKSLKSSIGIKSIKWLYLIMESA